jgi:hypothetical protein
LLSPGDPRAGQFVVEVGSLGRAGEALRRLGLTADTTARDIRIAPAAMFGLRLILQEAQSRLP